MQCPAVFVSGLADQLVPPSMMLDLYTQCSSRRKLLLQIANADHNGTWAKPQYFQQLVRHVDDVCSDRQLLLQHDQPHPQRSHQQLRHHQSVHTV